ANANFADMSLEFCPRITLIDANEIRQIIRSARKPELLPANHVNTSGMADIVYKQESYAIVGACFEVYNEKGCGFLEPVYQECLAIEFEYQRVPAIPKPSLTLSYRERILTQ